MDCRSSHSTPSSPRLLPRRVATARELNSSILPPLAAFEGIESSGGGGGSGPSLNCDSGGSSGGINWQERCLELQLELHRSRAQATRTRDMLREKVSHINV